MWDEGVQQRVRERVRGCFPSLGATHPAAAGGKEFLRSAGREGPRETRDQECPRAWKGRELRKMDRTYNSFSIPRYPGSGPGAQQPPRTPRAARAGESRRDPTLARAARAELTAAGSAEGGGAGSGRGLAGRGGASGGSAIERRGGSSGLPR